MLLAYLDESYDKVEYWLTALAVPTGSALALQNALDAIVDNAAASGYDIPVDAELHGYPLVHGKGDWTSMARMVRARIKIYADAIDVIASCEGVELVLRGIDIPALNARYTEPWHPHRVAIDFMAQTLNGMAKGRNTHFMAIADDIDQADTLRASYWQFQRFGTLSRYAGKIDRAVDALHFAPSKHSRLLQAADLVSYLHFRRRRSNVTDPRAVKVNDDLWDRIKGRLYAHHIW